MYGESKCFIKPFIKLDTFSNIQNSHQKILQKILSYNFRSVESSFRSVESSFRSIECSFDRLNRNRMRLIHPEAPRLYSYHFDRSSQSFDQSKMLNFEFLLRKFQNLNFYFMKQHSPNSNIIIKTYSCIYLYIQ